ncbi:MAG TPA: UDP-glucose 4-epimerase GalE [Terriglobia bacterium]|nr:UDP-glucose 4-epimerase GalE [Terriglobia bacterium]
MILVTGGAGYIGSHTVKALRNSGFDPLIFDNFSTGHRNFVGSTKLVEGDLSNPENLKRAFEDNPIEGVLHFAGKALVPESHRSPELYYATNVTGGINLLTAMKNAGVKKMIFSSTCATYGIPEKVPIDENTPQRPINPYGETKLAFEKALRWFQDSYGIEYLSLRYFNAAGADAEGDLGEDHDPETHLIPLVLDAAIGRKPEVRILGTDYPTPDGTCVRDFIHVSDLASAHVAGLQALLSGKIASQAINLGTGSGYSVREVVETARRITKSEFLVTEAERREGDPPVLVAAVDRAKSKLGWKAVASDLEQIISSAWNWHRRRFASR